MTVVVKEYKLKITERQQISLSEYFQLLGVRIEDNDLILMALVDESQFEIPTTIGIYETGTPIPNNNYLITSHVSSIQVGESWFHIFNHGYV